MGASDARPSPPPVRAAVAVRGLGGPERWPALVSALARRPGFWWLDSALQRLPLGRYSFAGAEPWAVLRARGDAGELRVHRRVRPDLAREATALRGDPLDAIARLLPPRPRHVDAGPPFVGGCVGWLGYELTRFTEGLAPFPPDDVGLPELCLLGVDRLVAWDALEGRVQAWAVGFGEGEAAAARAARDAVGAYAADLEASAEPAASPALGPSRALPRHGHFDADTYAKAVGRVLEAIEAGDVYQVNLTHRIEVPFAGDPWNAYRILREHNPAPFGAYLALPEGCVLSSSPERFLRLEPDGRVESRPMKGTLRRGGDPASDAEAARALAASEKDRAENLMIVDLVRHDLGRVCETGSVHVPELQAIEPYATVHQMVSTVRGRLRPDASPWDLLRATFPPGSMTGAPKRAAVSLAAELEPVRRGVYSGALGYFDLRGGLDLSVVIRTALVCGGRAFVHVGGGVVADSRPDAEWRESWDKAAAILASLERA